MRTVVMMNKETGHMARLSDTVQNGTKAIKFEYKEGVWEETCVRIYENANMLRMVGEGRKRGFEVVSA